VLDLEGNWIEKEGTIHLTEMIKENLNLTEVVSKLMFPPISNWHNGPN
jgi:hypothetical protein